MKWALPVIFVLIQFCGKVVAGLFFSQKLVAVFCWPSMLAASWFNWSPMDDRSLAMWIWDLAGWAVTGFLVGLWLDDRTRRRELMKKHLRE